MARNVIVLDSAREDIQAGKEFYDSCEVGVGDYFVECILADLSSLKFYFGIHRQQYGYYRLLSKRFPFAVYYDAKDGVVLIVAILDMRMKPSRILNMVKDR